MIIPISVFIFSPFCILLVANLLGIILLTSCVLSAFYLIYFSDNLSSGLPASSYFWEPQYYMEKSMLFLYFYTNFRSGGCLENESPLYSLKLCEKSGGNVSSFQNLIGRDMNSLSPLSASWFLVCTLLVWVREVLGWIKGCRVGKGNLANILAYMTRCGQHWLVAIKSSLISLTLLLFVSSRKWEHDEKHPSFTIDKGCFFFF